MFPIMNIDDNNIVWRNFTVGGTGKGEMKRTRDKDLNCFDAMFLACFYIPTNLCRIRRYSILKLGLKFINLQVSVDRPCQLNKLNSSEAWLISRIFLGVKKVRCLVSCEGNSIWK